MDNGSVSALEKPPWEKSPWETVVFQQSLFPTETLLKEFNIVIDASWTEMPHTFLTEVKSRIEPLEKHHVWETLKKRTNPFELVYTQDNTECPASLSLLRPLSRSYFKMIEILSISEFFEKIPKGTQKIRSAHVAEGPGGFIEALLDRSSMYRIGMSRIFAMTLKPTNNHIPGWRRAYTFLQKHPEIKIHYGHDGTGDLYVRENQTSFIDLFASPKALLFTGDGGFDFSVDYENQEKSMYTLLIASAITGLQVLAADGTFVLKLFDLFSPATQFLVRLITFCFREWVLYKPLMSRPCNSERYLVCRGFRKLPPVILSLLRSMEQKAKEELFPNVSPFSFFSEKEKAYLESHILESSQRQIQNIEKTIQQQSVSLNEYDWKQQYQNAHQWCLHFRVPCNKPKLIQA